MPGPEGNPKSTPDVPSTPNDEVKPVEENKKAEEYEQSVIYNIIKKRGQMANEASKKGRGKKNKNKPEGDNTNKPEETPLSEVDNAVIAVVHNEADRENIIAEAIEMKADKLAEDKSIRGSLVRAAKRVPIVGTIVKAGLMSHYKGQAIKAIDNSIDYETAYKNLGIDAKNSKLLNGKNNNGVDLARQLLHNAGYDKNNKIEKATSYLDTSNKVEMVGDEKTQQEIRSALNDYYSEIKKNPDNAEKIDQDFINSVKTAIGDEAVFKEVEKTIIREKEGLKKLSEEGKKNDNKIKEYLEKDFTLYRATVREGLYTKKEVDSLSKAVLAGSAFGVIASVLANSSASRTTRKAAVVFGASGAVAGGLAGAVAGAIRGADKARVNLSAHEINQATSFGEQQNDGAEASTGEEKDKAEKNTARKEKAKSVVDRIKRFSKGKDLLEQLDERRNRKNASDYIELLNKYKDGKDDDESYKELLKKVFNKDGSDEEVTENIEDVFADIIARGRLSSEQNIDLIRYDKGQDELESALLNAVRKFRGEGKEANIDTYLSELGNRKINERLNYLREEQEEAKKIEAKFKARSIAVNAISGALVGAGAGALVSELKERGIFGAIVGAVKGEGGTEGEDVDLDKLREFKGKPVLIENDPDGGMSIGIDTDGDGAIDAGEFLRGEGDEAGIDLTNDEQFEELNSELGKYRIELQREAIETSRYGETTIDNYLENANNTVDTSGGVDWGRSATRVAFGTPTATIEDGMDNYEIPVWGVNGDPIPDGAKFYIDLDGEGPGDTLEYTIENGKAIVPADVLDTSHVGNGGAASFIGTARVGEMDGNTMISYATAIGKDADLSSTISASAEGTGYAFTAIDMDSGEGLSQFAVDANNKIISNMSEIYNGIEVDGSERMPVTFMTKDIGDDASGITLANGEKIADFDYKGGYHPEYDSYQNDAFIESKSFLGTPIKWDLDGDGQMSPAEEATFFKQLLVRTGTDPFVLAQNASNYGLLEPDRLEEIIPRDQLISWGISDGTIDNMTDLNVMIEHLKMPENAELYDKLVNSTINEMQSQMDGGSFSVETITDRASTYTNSSHEIDAWRGSNARTILYARNKDGEIIGNQGVICRTLGIQGGKVGTLTDCGGQTGGNLLHEKTTDEGTKSTGEKTTGESTKTTKEKVTKEKVTKEKITDEKTTSEKTAGEKTTSEETIEQKDYENMRRIDNNIDEDIEKNVGTDDINHHTDLGTTEPTEKPSGNDYEGTGPSTTPNDSASEATPVQEDISQENDYSQNNGGAHDNAYSPNTDNDSGQSAANNTPAPAPKPAPEPAPAPEVEKGTESFEEVMEDLNK